MSVPPAFPPESPVFFPDVPGFTPPGLLLPPPIPIPVEPPCDEDDEDCEPPPPPPEAPEPGIIFILLIGALAVWYGVRRPGTASA